MGLGFYARQGIREDKRYTNPKFVVIIIAQSLD
jgi:hypothetical protein